MSLPEGAPARPGSAWARGGAVSSVVTSGCPKRSEGGCPCRNEDEHRPSSRIPIEKHTACLPIIDKTLPLVLNKITLTRKNLLTWVFETIYNPRTVFSKLLLLKFCIFEFPC